MQKSAILKLLCLAAFLLLNLGGFGLNSYAAELSKEEKSEVVKRLQKLVAENYFSESGAKIAAHLEERLKTKAYDTLESLPAFTNALTKDLQFVTKDKHLYIRFDKQRQNIPTPLKDPLLDEQQLNHGIRKLSILAGNIGYLEVSAFSRIDEDPALAAAAMNFLKNTDALIIDLRANGGGSDWTLLASYLLPEENILLNTIYWNNGEKMEMRTRSELDAPRFLDRDVYLLTSNSTFSAAEAFTYALKSQGRVVLVGERTRGGANPNRIFPLHQFADGSTLGASIPVGRTINAVTKTNWEGAGIEPDYRTTAAAALDKAQLIIIEKRLAAEKNEEKRRLLGWLKDETAARLNPFRADAEKLKAFTGVYGAYRVTGENGQPRIFLADEPEAPRKLIPLDDSMMMIEGTGKLRVRFETENGQTKMTVLYRDGRAETLTRAASK
jgi:hypothetical protein